MYVKINTQEEADDIVEFIKSKGHSVENSSSYSKSNCYLCKGVGLIGLYYFDDRLLYSQDRILVTIEEFKRDLPDLNKPNNEYTEHFDSIDIENKKILDSLHEMLVEKNKKYGDAALNPLEIFAGKCKYGYRVDEKLSRIKNSEQLCEADVVDILGGLVIICREKGWNDFSKYKN